jgi:hypothetical protein
MKASKMIEKLQGLIDEHGDLELTVAPGPYEYSVIDVGYAAEGPLPGVGEMQHQNPPERFCFDVKDDIPDIP